MNHIEVMKQARDVLMFFRYAPPAQRPAVMKAIADLEQALAAPVQEPVAWLYPEGLEALQNGKCWTAYPTKHDGCNIPLCVPPAAQPAPVPLAHAPRCAGCDLVNGCPEFCKCNVAQPAPMPLTDDTRRLDALAKNSWDLRCFDMSDDDIGWRVIEHHMAKPHERTVAEVFRDDPRQAIDAAIEAAAPEKGSTP